MWPRRILSCHYFWLCDFYCFLPFCWQNNSCKESILPSLAETISPCITKDRAIDNNLDNKKAHSKITITNKWLKMAPSESEHEYILERDFVFSGIPNCMAGWILSQHVTTILTTYEDLDGEEHQHKDRTQWETTETDLMTRKLLNIAITSLSNVL